MRDWGTGSRLSRSYWTIKREKIPAPDADPAPGQRGPVPSVPGNRESDSVRRFCGNFSIVNTEVLLK